MTSDKGRKIHGDASNAREQGDFLKALQLIDEVTIIYSEDKDYLGLSEIQGMRSLTLRHLHRKSGDINYLILAKYSSMAAVDIAEKAEVSKAIPLFDLAKVQEEIGQLGEASETYEDAVEAFGTNPPESHNRPGVLADMKVHMYTCMYKAGDKSALPKAMYALIELHGSDEKTVSKYNYDVWLSGGNMRLAEILKDTDLELAKKHLEEAKKIIDESGLKVQSAILLSEAAALVKQAVA